MYHFVSFCWYILIRVCTTYHKIWYCRLFFFGNCTHLKFGIFTRGNKYLQIVSYQKCVFVHWVQRNVSFAPPVPRGSGHFKAGRGRARKGGAGQGRCSTWRGRAAYFPSLPSLISITFISISSIIMIINIMVIARKSSGSFDGRGWQHRDLLIWLSSSLIAFWCSTPYFLWPEIWDFILQMKTVIVKNR